MRRSLPWILATALAAVSIASLAVAVDARRDASDLSERVEALRAEISDTKALSGRVATLTTRERAAARSLSLLIDCLPEAVSNLSNVESYLTYGSDVRYSGTNYSRACSPVLFGRADR